MIIAGLLEEILTKWYAKRVIEKQLIEFKTASKKNRCIWYLHSIQEIESQ